MRWSEAVTLEFVKIYLKHECLWNSTHPEYKNKYHREKSYSAIISEFKASTTKTLTVADVKIKIKNLRTTYLQQVHKILLKSSPDSIYEPSLIWFHEMDRCLKYLPNNRHTTAQESNEVDSSSQIWVDQEMQNVDNELIHPDPLVPHSDYEYDSKDNEPTVKAEKRSSPIFYKKHKKKKNIHRSSESTDSNVDCVKDDEFDIYGKYIAAQLRKMALHKALRLQLEIQTLVSEARMSDIISSD